jgi:hypothetical protein
VVGRIYPEIIQGKPKWMWFLQTEPAPPPNSGVTGSLEEAKAGFKARQKQARLIASRENRVLLYNSDHGRCTHIAADFAAMPQSAGAGQLRKKSKPWIAFRLGTLLVYLWCRGTCRANGGDNEATRRGAM